MVKERMDLLELVNCLLVRPPTSTSGFRVYCVRRMNSTSRQRTIHSTRIKNCSLREAYPTREWEEKARAAIRECDVVIVLIGEDTHNATGVRTEVDLARGLGKPVFQVRPQKRAYSGLSDLEKPIPGKWKRINKKLDAL